MGNPLQDKVVLVSLQIRHWTGRKLDKKVSAEVNEERHAKADAGRFHKQLIAKKAFDRVYAATREARDTHHRMSLAWFDEGPRILANEFIKPFYNKIGELEVEFNDAADEFKQHFPKYLIDAKQTELGRMFNAQDYPDASTVRSLFSFKVTTLPFPDAGDIRVDIGKEQLEDAKRQMEEALGNAMRDPIQRIIEVTAKMAERLKNYKPATNTDKAEHAFRDSLVGNIQDLVTLLPAFNITNDKKLAELTTLVEERLCKHSPVILREDEKIRKIVCKNAEDILKKAQALMA